MQGFFHIVVQLEIPAICFVVDVELWIVTVAGLAVMKKDAVDIVEVYLAAIITGAR